MKGLIQINRSVVFVSLLLLMCNTVMAQLTPPGVRRPNGPLLHPRGYMVAVGATGGYGIAMGTASRVYDFRPTMSTSYHFGLAVNAQFIERGRRGFRSDGGFLFGVEVEALYGSRNTKVSGTLARLNCLEFPILVQYYPLSSLGVEAGITAVKFLGYSPDYLQIGFSHLHLGQISGGDMMPTIGVCYKTPFGLMLNARYYLGLSNLAGNLDSKMSTAIVSMTYLIPIIK